MAFKFSKDESNSPVQLVHQQTGFWMLDECFFRSRVRVSRNWCNRIGAAPLFLFLFPFSAAFHADGFVTVNTENEKNYDEEDESRRGDACDCSNKGAVLNGVVHLDWNYVSSLIWVAPYGV
jgi:hypothetical protein